MDFNSQYLHDVGLDTNSRQFNNLVDDKTKK